MYRKTFMMALSVTAIIFTAHFAWAATVRLAWDPNSESTLAGYKLHFGNAKGSYTEIIVLKDFVAEILENIRSRLIEMRFPFQLINFILHSRDYDNLNVLNQRTVRDTTQYFVSFEYPEGMEPFPIPDILKTDQSIFPPAGKMEKNFVVLTDIQGSNGVITKFMPTLRSKLAPTINKMLDNCEFSKSPLKFQEIIRLLLPLLVPMFSSESIRRWKVIGKVLEEPRLVKSDSQKGFIVLRLRRKHL